MVDYTKLSFVPSRFNSRTRHLKAYYNFYIHLCSYILFQVNACTPDMSTPLHRAAFHGYKKVAEILLEKKAYINAQVR